MSEPVNPKVLLEVHLAEYQALTNRSTYWITLQYAFWPILGIFYTLVATASNSFHNVVVLAWGTVLGTLILTETYYFALHEVYETARYIEHKLKPLIESAIGIESEIGDSHFWLYESYLRDQRSVKPRWGESFPIVLGGIAIGIAVKWRMNSWLLLDCVGLMVSIIVFVVLAWFALAVVQLRRDILLLPKKRSN